MDITKPEDLVTRFGVVDYVVFVGMLAVSASIGFYYACSGNRQRTAAEFLMADRSMGAVPIGLSLLASFVSSVGLLGIPAEIYTFGTSYWMSVLCFLIVIPVSAYVYLPVFYNLRLTSAYEYLEKRFNRAVRRFASIIFMFEMILYMAMVTYAPALALSQVTGLHIWASISSIGIVGICYTTIGGMKAVMWTDAFQIIVMVTSMLAVNIQGLMTMGGFEGIWKTAQEGERIASFNFSPDPLIRHTFWCLTIGGTITWVAIYGVNQTQVQRYSSAPTKRTAQVALWINLPGLLFTISLCSFTGLVLYAKFKTCDPIKAKAVEMTDQLLPLYVMESLGEFPGLPGFFVAGLFSGSLSTFSSGLNSLAAVTLEDYLRITCCKNISEEKAGLLSKLIAFLYGVFALVLIAVVEQLGNILQAAVSIFGITGGPLLGVFTLGMFFPCANSMGALMGLTSSLAFVMWIVIGAQVSKYPQPTLPMSVAGCNMTDLLIETLPETENDILSLYKISYQWYSAIACFTVIIVGIITSITMGCQSRNDVDSRLLSPIVRSLFSIVPEKIRKTFCYNVKDVKNENTHFNGSANCDNETNIYLLQEPITLKEFKL